MLQHWLRFMNSRLICKLGFPPSSICKSSTLYTGSHINESPTSTSLCVRTSYDYFVDRENRSIGAVAVVKRPKVEERSCGKLDTRAEHPLRRIKIKVCVGIVFWGSLKFHQNLFSGFGDMGVEFSFIPWRWPIGLYKS